MTLREQIQAELVVAEAKVAELKAHLATGGQWLEMEAGKLRDEVVGLFAYFKSKPAAAPIPAAQVAAVADAAANPTQPPAQA